MDYLFENVNVFDGEHESLIKNTCVYVSNGKIKKIGKPVDFADVERVDCSGMTMLPGLVDCHANIVGLITAEQKFGVTP